MAGELAANFSQIAATSQAWLDMGDEADHVGKTLKNGVPDLFVVFGGDGYAKKVVPNLQPAVDGAINLLDSVTGQCNSTGKKMMATGQKIAQADGVNASLVPPPHADAPAPYTPHTPHP